MIVRLLIFGSLMLNSFLSLCQSAKVDKSAMMLNTISKAYSIHLYEGGVQHLLNAFDSCTVNYYLMIYTNESDQIVIDEYQNRSNCKKLETSEKVIGRCKIDVQNIDVSNVALVRQYGSNMININSSVSYGDEPSKYNKNDFDYHDRNIISFVGGDINSLASFKKEFTNLIVAYKRQILTENMVNNAKSKTIIQNTDSSIREQKVNLIKENGVLIVEVNISSVKQKFILDSGAGECSISSDLEKKLLSSGIINARDYLEDGVYLLADGSQVKTKRVKIPFMKAGNKTIKDVIVSVGSSISPNLLGQSFLNKLNKWSINNAGNVLTFQ